MPLHQLRPLSSDELEPVIQAHAQATHASVDPDLVRGAYLALLETRWARDHVQVMGWFEDGRLAGALRVHHLEMLINGSKRSCAGVSGILALGGRRAREVTAPMVDEAARYLRGRYSACFLFAGSDVAVFRSLGFTVIPNVRFVLSRAGLRNRPADGVGGNGNGHGRGGLTVESGERLVVEAKPFVPSDLPDLIQVYNHDTSLRKLGLLRSEAYWEHLFERERLERLLRGEDEGAQKTWVCRIDDRVAGYMAVRQRGGRMEILESPAESFRAQSWMLRYAVHLSTTALIERLEGQLPWRAEETGFGMQVRRDLPVMMLHPLSSGLRGEEFQQPSDNFLWHRDRF